MTRAARSLCLARPYTFQTSLASAATQSSWRCGAHSIHPTEPSLDRARRGDGRHVHGPGRGQDGSSVHGWDAVGIF